MKLLLTICFWILLCIHMSWAWTTFGMGMCIILFFVNINWESVVDAKIKKDVDFL